MCCFCSHCYVPELFLGMPVLLLLGNPSFIGVTSRARGSALHLWSHPRCPQFHRARDPRADWRLKTPNHPQATPIIQPRTSLADQRQSIPSVSIHSLSILSPWSCILRIQNRLHEFKWAALWKSTALILQAGLEPLTQVRAGKGRQSS